MTYIQSPWSLADLFPTQESPEMNAAFDELDVKVVEFEALRPSLSSEMSQEAFLNAIHLLEAISRLANRISDFAELSFAADTKTRLYKPFNQMLRAEWLLFLTAHCFLAYGGRAWKILQLNI